MPVELPANAFQKRRGRDHRQQNQRCGNNRPGDLVHRLARGLDDRDIGRIIQHVLDVFHDQNCVVHHKPDGEDKRQQGNHVQRIANGEQHRDRTQHRGRNGKR